MLIRKSTEYVLGTPTRRELRKLSGQREQYSWLQFALAMLVFIAPGFGLLWATSSGFLTDRGALIIFVLVWVLPVFVLFIHWATLPSARYVFACEWEREGKLIRSEDPIFGLIMTDPVTIWLNVDKYHGNTVTKQAVDAFIEFLLPCCDRYAPENSQFLSPAWEKEHGKLYKHPTLVAVGEAARDLEGLQSHVRQTVRSLQTKRLAQLQKQQIADGKKADANREELFYLQLALLHRT